ncbi:MAG: hypothetical protein GWN67_26095 [Phycisphaerae bacterium]|nr:hypothetical protein [Phycisphaerae bacterium]NIR63427.1 hypothetical protein [candidate division Zixibacteria bacterium]NIP55563.1 hypothetical protein [Phycisphaerae bacterium]NIS54794.1 hypothetical protein [Phycisphaerae bacterium]NIU11893.1 hypothetical protein [Phycisphaerae bacterium]
MRKIFSILVLVVVLYAGRGVLASEVVVWGSNTDGQCSVPLPNEDFVAVCAGDYHNLGLKADGSIVAWGRNDLGQCDLPLPNGGFVAVAAGIYHSLGLKADGSIVLWGDNNYGQCDVPLPNENFVAVAGGGYHSLGLKADGSITAWGYDTHGQCDVPLPNENFVSVAAGDYHSLGLKTDGSIMAWGQNEHGQCTVPLPNEDFVAVAGGADHSLGLKAKPMGTGFTYQGRLLDANSTVDGLYDFEFSLYNAEGIMAVNSIRIDNLDVIYGYFTVELDFGSDVFDGFGNWLEIGVRPGHLEDPNDYTILSPRQKVTPTTYALQTSGSFVDSAGNIGIGTNSPTARLDIANLSSGPAIAVGRSPGYPSIVARSDASSGWLVMDSTGAGNVGLNQYDDGDVIMVYGGGNVGIGTANPMAKLDIANLSSEPAISVGRSVGNPSIVASSVASDGWLMMDSTGDGSVGLNQYDDGNVIMAYGGGNVGIGTANPTAKLEVNGTIKATALVGDGSGLTNGAPDDDCIVTEPNIIYREDGNVGIGTASPKAKLDIAHPSSGIAIAVGRSHGNPSIVARSDAHDGWLVLDSTGDGSVGLNQYDDGNVIMAYGGGNVGIGTDSPTAKLEVSGGIINDFTIYRNEQPSGTDGGAFTPGSWTTRTLNTTLDEYGTSISRSGSQITLAAGTYYVDARAPAFHVNRHKAVLYNVTDAQNALIGSSAYSDYESDDAQTDSVIRGTITISGTKTFEIRHRSQGSGTYGNERGLASNFGVVEVYTEIYIRKLR